MNKEKNGKISEEDLEEVTGGLSLAKAVVGAMLGTTAIVGGKIVYEMANEKPKNNLKSLYNGNPSGIV